MQGPATQVRKDTCSKMTQIDEGSTRTPTPATDLFNGRGPDEDIKNISGPVKQGPGTPAKATGSTQMQTAEAATPIPMSLHPIKTTFD